MGKIHVGSLFSGIGAFEFALERLNVPFDIVFACDNGERDIDKSKVDEGLEEIKFKISAKEKADFSKEFYSRYTRKTNFVEITYLQNYEKFIDDDLFYQDARMVDGRDFKGGIDLLVGGSPCQSFSVVGAQKGFEDTRGTLFYDFARIIRDSQPKAFIYENVRGLLTNNKGKTWQRVQDVFCSLGYRVKYDLLNAVDFGIPQNRRRLIVVGTRDNVKFDFYNVERKTRTFDVQAILEDKCSFGNYLSDPKGEIIPNHVPGPIPSGTILSPAVRKYVMSSGTKTFYVKPVIDLPIARPLLSTMGNHHRAGIDNYYTVPGSNGLIRSLSPREALRLMGFVDSFEIPKEIKPAHIYKQAGNSIVVDMLMSIIKLLIEKKAFD